MAEPLPQQRLKHDTEPGSVSLEQLMRELEDTFIQQDTFGLNDVVISPARALQSRLQDEFSIDLYGVRAVHPEVSATAADATKWSPRRTMLVLFVSCGIFWAGVFALVANFVL
jgi:hypothetical protein